jgi:hypothetical protein
VGSQGERVYCVGAALKYLGLILQRYGLVEGTPDNEASRLLLSVPLDNLVVKRLPLDCQEEMMSIFLCPTNLQT